MATRDILDFLSPEYQEYKDQSDKFYLKSSIQKIAIAPRYWDTYGAILFAYNFNWVSVKYTELDKYLSEDRTRAAKCGIYLFSVGPRVRVNRLPECVFYVGIAGEHGSTNPLRERLRNYIQISGIERRDKVRTALAMYHQDVTIHYCEFDDTSELSQIEEYLHGFYLPWANDRDFPVNIKHARNAF